MLQAQLTAAESALAAKLAARGGDALCRVDFDQLRIERAQGEAQLAEASAAAVAVKAQVAQVQLRLADQHSWLARSGKEDGQLRRQISAREAHAAQQAAEAGKVHRETASLQLECERLRTHAKTGGAVLPDAGAAVGAATSCARCGGSPEGATIFEYMQLQNSCASLRKRIADWRRKIDIARGRSHALPAS